MVRERGDEAVLELTRRFDATEGGLEALAVDPARAQIALDEIDAPLREALETAADNIRAVAEAQIALEPAPVDLPQGHRVEVHDVPVGAAGIYAPGGRAAYPSSVLMCGIPAQVAGVERVVLATPPAPDGEVSRVVLAAAALCGIEEIYAMGGAQAVFALAYGTETIKPVDLIAGPGNEWVTEAKRAVYGTRRRRLPRRPVGADGDRRPRGRRRCRRTRPLRPGRARGGEPADPRRRRGGHRRGDHRGRASASPPSGPASPTRRSRCSRSPTPATRSRSPTPTRPSTSRSSPRTPPSSPATSPPPAASSSARSAPPPSATTTRAPTTSCRPAAPAASPARSGPAPSAGGCRTST